MGAAEKRVLQDVSAQRLSLQRERITRFCPENLTAGGQKLKWNALEDIMWGKKLS